MKNIPFTQAQFVGSAFSHENCPHLLSPSGTQLPEIAIVGRSNVGKSSLINHLLRNSKLARVSSTPGKTQLLNFYCIDQRIVLVDLPGYGYAKVPKTLKEQWSQSIDLYLKNRKNLQLILFLLDSRRVPTEEDQAFVQWATFNQKPLLLIFTKTDKLKESELREQTLSSLAAFNHLMHASPVRFLHYSIKDPRARIELIEKINTLLICG